MTIRKTDQATSIRTFALAGLLAAAVFLPAASLPMRSAYEVNTSTGMTLAGAPLAVHGYDQVAYFTEGRARAGKAAFSVKHGNAAYRFVSEANKKKFESNPERYVPQYGGYCAFGVAVGAKFDGDPTLFRVVDDKLYLNLNPAIQATWEKDIAGNIVKADGNWTQIRDKAPSELK